MVKVAKSRVVDRNIGLTAFHLCYSLEVALNRLAIGGIGSEKKIRHVLVGKGGCIPLIPPLDPPLKMASHSSAGILVVTCVLCKTYGLVQLGGFYRATLCVAPC